MIFLMWAGAAFSQFVFPEECYKECSFHENYDGATARSRDVVMRVRALATAKAEQIDQFRCIINSSLVGLSFDVTNCVWIFTSQDESFNQFIKNMLLLPESPGLAWNAESERLMINNFKHIFNEYYDKYNKIKKLAEYALKEHNQGNLLSLFNCIRHFKGKENVDLTFMNKDAQLFNFRKKIEELMKKIGESFETNLFDEMHDMLKNFYQNPFEDLGSFMDPIMIFILEAIDTKILMQNERFSDFVGFKIWVVKKFYKEKLSLSEEHIENRTSEIQLFFKNKFAGPVFSCDVFELYASLTRLKQDIFKSFSQREASRKGKMENQRSLQRAAQEGKEKTQEEKEKMEEKVFSLSKITIREEDEEFVGEHATENLEVPFVSGAKVYTAPDPCSLAAKAQHGLHQERKREQSNGHRPIHVYDLKRIKELKEEFDNMGYEKIIELLSELFGVSTTKLGHRIYIPVCSESYADSPDSKVTFPQFVINDPIDRLIARSGEESKRVTTHKPHGGTLKDHHPFWREKIRRNLREAGWF